MSLDSLDHVDRECVLMLVQTSGDVALATCQHDVAIGIPAYDDLHGYTWDPMLRAEVRQCHADNCFNRFWTSPVGSNQAYCSRACKRRAYAQRLRSLGLACRRPPDDDRLTEAE